MWITINEPYKIAWYGYGTGHQAPGIKDPGSKPYVVGHNLILAHVRAYQVYKSLASKEGGKVGIALTSDWKISKTKNQDDEDAVKRAVEFTLGWFANPIFGDGNYPEIMRNRAGTRLPNFTPDQMRRNKGK